MADQTIQSTLEDDTPFFRETEHFTFLSQTVVSDLLAGASLGRERQVRVWGAACSTGEEAYAIAIALSEGFSRRPVSTDAVTGTSDWSIQVIGTDTDLLILEKAREGIYSELSLSDFPQDAKKRYFMRGRGNMAGKVRVKQSLADMVRFQPVDLENESWPVEGPFDAIFYRDALAGHTPAEQELILRGMLRRLHPHAYLILGSAEHVPWLKDAVTPLGRGIHQLRPRRNMRYKGQERRSRSRQGLSSDSP